MKNEKLSRSDFRELSRFIYEKVGIHLSDAKILLLETRIRKRMQKLDIKTYAEYTAYLFSNKGMETELEMFINAVTTNKTDFFRESDHFTYLEQVVLPELLMKRVDLRFWSSACSRGHEPYTMAMVLENYRQAHPTSHLHYSILATDIDTSVLQTAKKGVYPFDEITPVPEKMQRRFLMRSKDPLNKSVRIIPELREKISFQQLNLISAFRFKTPLDVIFCRNVIIYFDRETQHRLIMRFIDQLADDGYLFMGHSEVLNIHEFPLVSVAPAVYRKRR